MVPTKDGVGRQGISVIRTITVFVTMQQGEARLPDTAPASKGVDGSSDEPRNGRADLVNGLLLRRGRPPSPAQDQSRATGM